MPITANAPQERMSINTSPCIRSGRTKTSTSASATEQKIAAWISADTRLLLPWVRSLSHTMNAESRSDATIPAMRSVAGDSWSVNRIGCTADRGLYRAPGTPVNAADDFRGKTRHKGVAMQDELKKKAAEEAVTEVKSGQVL